MKKLIPKYQNPAATIRVRIQNNDSGKEGEWGYVDVDKHGRPLNFNKNTGEFGVHRGSPNGKIFWTSKADNDTDYRSPTPSYDQSTPFENPKNREQIATNNSINQNNTNYYLWKNASEEILRNWQLQNQQGAHKLWYDSSGQPHHEFGEQGMSGADPLGRFYVEGNALAKPLQLAGKGLLYGTGRWGSGAVQNWSRAKLISGEIDKQISNGLKYPFVQQIETTLRYNPTQNYNISKSNSLRFTPISYNGGRKDLNYSFTNLADYNRMSAIKNYIYTGNKTQPVDIGVDIKPIDYSSKFHRLETSSLPQGSELTYQYEVIPRMVDSRVREREKLLRTLDYGDGPVNLSEKEIQTELQKYREELTSQMNDLLENRGYIHVTPEVMKEYNFRHFTEPTRTIAFYDPDTKKIVVSNVYDRYGNPQFIKSLNHEVRHWYDDLFPLTKEEETYLRQAYNDTFDDIPNIYAGYDKEYNMNPERVTVNRDSREVIFDRYFRPKSISEQNKLIDEIPKDEIIYAVENANGYGSDYIKTLRNRNMINDELIQAFRNAMKYVGISTGVGVTLNGLNNSNNSTLLQ